MLLEEQVSFNALNVTPDFVVSVAFVVVIAFILIVIAAFKIYHNLQKPEYKVTDETYNDLNIGCKVESKISTILPSYWEITTKKLEETEEGLKRDYMTVFSKDPLETVETKKWHILNYGVLKIVELPHYFLSKQLLPPRLWYDRKILSKGKKNAVIYFFFRLLLRPKRIHDVLKYEYATMTNEKGETVRDTVKEIKILQLEYAQPQKSFEFFTEFEQKEFIEGQDVYAWVKYPEIELKSIVTRSVPKLKGIITKYDLNAPSLLQTLIPENEYFVDKLNDRKHELYNEYLEIQNMLLKRNEEINVRIEQGLLKSENRNYYYSLSQIEDMKRSVQYRKVERKGDPIVRLYEIENLAKAQQNATSIRELRTTMDLKLEEKDVQIREVWQLYQKERDKVNELQLGLEAEEEKRVLDAQKGRKQAGVSDKIAFAYEAMELKKIGYKAEEAIAELIVKKSAEGKKDGADLENLRKENKSLKEMLVKIAKETKYEFPIESTPTEISNMKELNKFIEEKEI